MKHLFKVYCLIFITVSSIYGQEITIHNEILDTDSSTKILLDLKNINFRVEPSDDDKVHILLRTTFQNYSKKNIEKYRKRVKVGLLSSNDKDLIGVIGSGSFWSAPNSYFYMGNFRTFKKDTVFNKKTKQQLMEEIDFDGLKTLDLIKLKPKVVKMKSSKRVRSFSENFVIKVPKGLKIKIKGTNTNFALMDIENPLEININRGGIHTTTLSNSSNNVHLKDAFLRAEKINGGTYQLNDVYKGLIGEIKNATIASSFSSIEIAEIGKNVEITDFNGKLWFYDFSKDFEEFTLESEYSKLNFYDLGVGDARGKLLKVLDNKEFSVDGSLDIDGQKFNYKISNGLLYYHK